MMSRGSARAGKVLFPLILPVTLLLAWEAAGRGMSNVYLPPLSSVLQAFVDDWLFDATEAHLLQSLWRFAVGYLVGSALGILLGVAIGASRRIADYLDPTLEFLRALPAVAIIPVAVLLFGLGSTMRVSVIVFGVLFPVLVNTAVGVRSTRQERIDSARMYGLSRLAVVRRVMVPSALPMISAGLRVGLPIALIMMVVSELIGGGNGIGFYLIQRQSLFDTSGMLAAILILGVLGNLVNAAYAALESRFLSWANNV
jgi:ABC-type nitrate/sulfonate/bicarbonate transport system permease component